MEQIINLHVEKLPEGYYLATSDDSYSGTPTLCDTDSRLPEALETGLNVTARAADSSAAAAVKPRPTHPLESHLSALPRTPLMPFDATGRMANAIPFAFDDYLELVDATGRVIRAAA